MPPPPLPFIFLLISLFSPATLAADRLLLRRPRLSSAAGPQQYIDPTDPPPLLPTAAPSCSFLLLSHSFAYTYGLPPAAAFYAPPSRCPPWSRAVLSFSASSAGDQYDRVAAVWLSGSELLRTTTPEPNPSGIFWRVRRDVSRHAALLRQPGNLTVMLENIVDASLPGVFHVNVSLHFYSAAAAATPLYTDAPADVILPVSEKTSDSGHWFRIMNASDLRSAAVTIPRNAYRAVLEIYASPHGDDEFWYSNPPEDYITANRIDTRRGNGAYREINVTVDGIFAGSVVPFPTVYAGGINPLLWQPVLGLGALDIRPYDVDLTPFLGVLLDGESHRIGLAVADGISFWLVDANLHLWLDRSAAAVTAKLVRYHTPEISFSRKSHWTGLNGTFTVELRRTCRFAGWVSYSGGNVTTKANRKLKYKNTVVIADDGNAKDVKVKVKRHVNVKVSRGKTMTEYRTYETEYPLRITTVTEPAGDGKYIEKTNISHALHEEFDDELSGAASTVEDKQEGGGWMLVEGHSVLDGRAGTDQTYKYDGEGKGRYKRRIVVRDGVIVSDRNSTGAGSLWAAW